MTHFFTPHARTRAKERYDLHLTIMELSFIAHSCNTGTAALLRVLSNGTKVYCVTVRGVKTFPVISTDRVIVTFQPPDFMVASVAKKHRIAQGSTKKRPRRIGRPDSPRPYQRSRAAIAAQGGAE